MTSDQWQRFRDGVIGTFQPLTSPKPDSAPGMIRLTEEHAEVAFIASGDHVDERRLPMDCSAVFGETEAGDVLMMSIARLSSSWGAFPTARYHSRCLVLDPVAAEVEGDTVAAAHLRYYGLSGWSGPRRLRDDPIEENGQVVGWAAEVRWHEGTTVQLDDAFALRFSTGHSVTGPFDRRMLTAPLVITVESEQRQSVQEHLSRLDAVHALLAVAHREVPLASGGGVKFTASQRGSCAMWERTMMSLAPLDSVTHEFPHLRLEDVGGVTGVAAWVRLALEHRRAVEPIVRHALYPTQTPEARMLSTAAAMEYWVACNARKATWAKSQPGMDLPAALTQYVDEAWATWIGDTERWVKDFWATYLDLKHFRGTSPDPTIVHTLETAGRWLLTAALLDHCAGTNDASQHLFSKGLNLLGQHVREHLFNL